ncbi:aldolase [Gracilibacillus phocaeensis]|uniref:aldolase n=1 Tax=Gracilibacillus phocaeensis TaxID=2042304 RepID=UPI00103119DC|nr:aldolase [Gracilibacillus phocaeensis]
MAKTSNISCYKAFGLHIFSDLSLPELLPHCGGEEQPDVVIKKVDLSALWSQLAEPDSYYYIKKDLCLIHVSGVAIYRMEAGSVISYSPIAGVNDQQLRLYLLGTCFGVLLMQRKVLPMHGSGVIIDGKAYAIVGESGAGKSTLASAFLNRGFRLLTDDILAVTMTKNGHPLGIPSYPQQKLWQESLDEFGIASHSYQPIYQRETKYKIPVNHGFMDKPAPLAGVFVLEKAEQPTIEIAPIPKLACFPILYYHTFRHFMIQRAGLLDWHFSFSADLVNRLVFYQIVRPHLRFTAEELVDHILHLINDGANLENHHPSRKEEQLI